MWPHFDAMSRTRVELYSTAEFGAESTSKRKSPFVEMDVLREVFPYTKHAFTLVDVEILSVEGVLEYTAAGKPG